MECYAKYMAIGAITALTGYALYLGHNGVIFTSVIGVIAGLTGYEVAKTKGKEK